MTAFSFGDIASELKQTQEEGISFSDKALTWDTAEDVKDVVAAIESAKILHYLKLDGNTLGVDAAAAIGKALEKHPEFRKALWPNMFTRRLKTEIPQALKHLGQGLLVAQAQLTVLDLSDNALGPNGMVGLEDFLRSRVCYTLEELRLNNCGLGIRGGQMLSKAILDCHSLSTKAGTPLKLRIFIAGRNRLENDGAKAISKIFSTLKTLEEIVMPQNSIYHEGIAALAQGISANPNLRVLNLNDNTVTHKGAASLAEAFAHTPNLREINFGDCLLKTNGAYDFAEALGENHRDLEVVDLGYNEIGPDGGLLLVSELQNNPNLKKLILDGNQFGSEGRERIKEAMKSFAHPDALGSLDEDQSECEDDDNDDDEDEDDDGSEEGDEEEDEIYDDERHNDTTEEADEDDDYEGEYADEAEETAYTTTTAYTTKILNPSESFNSNKSVSFVTEPRSTGNTIEDFCLSRKPCALETFEALKEENILDALKNIINQFDGDNYLLLLIFTALKCAHLAKQSAAALDIAMALYKDAFDYAYETKQERRVLNYFLIQLKLLRCEEKFNSSFNLESCRFALCETLSKKKISSEHMRNAFKVFLDQAGV